jgi:general secretion pathway protein F
LAHFSNALSLLLKSGVPALVSLQTATPTIEDKKLRDELQSVSRDVAEGQGLAHSMEVHTRLPVFFTKMIAVGEESGRLSEVLDEITNSYQQQIESDIALVTSLLEPILILVFGLILGSIVLAILLPTFQITQMVH